MNDVPVLFAMLLVGLVPSIFVPLLMLDLTERGQRIAWLALLLWFTFWSGPPLVALWIKGVVG